MRPHRVLFPLLLLSACSSKWVRVHDADHILSFEVPAGWKLERLTIKTRRYRKAEMQGQGDLIFAVDDSAPPTDPARFIRKVLKESELHPGDGKWTTRKESRPGLEVPSINVYMEGSFTILDSTWQVRSRSWILDNTNVAIVTTYPGKLRTNEGDASAARVLEAAGP